MKTMSTPRGTARAQRRINGGHQSMVQPSASAKAAQIADQALANRKLSVKLYHKSGAGIA